MKVIFELSHPKHYYQFRYLIRHYEHVSGDVLILARDKDVLLRILKEEGHSFVLFGNKGRSVSAKLKNIFSLFIRYIKIVKRFRPDIICSKASPYAVLLRPFIKVKTLITPDSEVVKLTSKFVAPLSNIIVTPESYALNHGVGHRRISGFFEELYLSPKAFKPEKKYLSEFNIDPPFFLLRFISWNASHDVGNAGFTDEQKVKLYQLLKPHGTVLISAEEGKLPKELKSAHISFPPSKIHHIMHYANLYIGDSQSMATESALLGTPSFRYNSFVGENDMTNFIVLEKDHELLQNFSSFDLLYEAVEKALKSKDLKESWLTKRKEYFEDKEDVNSQLLAYLENA